MTHSTPPAAPTRHSTPLSTDAADRSSAPLDLSRLIASRIEAAGPSRPSLADGLLWTIEPVLAPPAPVPRAPRRPKLVGWLSAALAAGLVVVGGAIAFAQTRTPVAYHLEPSPLAIVEEAPPLPALVVRPPATPAAETPADTPVTRTRARAERRATPPARTVRTVAAPPAHSWETGGPAPAQMDRDIDSLLDAAIGDVSADPAHSDERVLLPETPTRRQVSSTLRALEGEVRQCGEGRVTVRLAVAGATGRVTDVAVSGAESPSTARCVEDAVETARFPHFERDSFTVNFPYSL